LTQINPFLKKGCLVTDTGSIKKQIVERANRALSKDIFFVGGPPMAGLEECAIESVDHYWSEPLRLDTLVLTTPCIPARAILCQ